MSWFFVLRENHACLKCPLCICFSEVSLSLLDAANDRDPVVQEQVRKSILTLGKQQPDKILSMCQDYLVKHPKVRQKMHLYVIIPTAHYSLLVCAIDLVLEKPPANERMNGK